MKKTARKNDEIKKMNGAKTYEQTDVCPSCENYSLCSFMYPERQHVFFCEEFTDSLAQTIPVTVKKQSDGLSEHRPPEKYNGLCSNCRNAYACVYPKDEAGIWHCEEYR